MSDTVPASCLQAPRAMIAAVLLFVASALSGCAGGGAPGSGSYAMAPSAGGGATVAFESIDGPPPQVFDRMVSVLDSESKLRSLSIVSREGGASYRVRGYLSAQVVRGKTMIAWVWDVYDNNQQRALRLSGEEAAGKPQCTLLVVVVDVPDPGDHGLAAHHLRRQIAAHAIGSPALAGDDRQVAQLRFAVEHADHPVEHLWRRAVDRFERHGRTAAR